MDKKFVKKTTQVKKIRTFMTPRDFNNVSRDFRMYASPWNT